MVASISMAKIFVLEDWSIFLNFVLKLFYPLPG